MTEVDIDELGEMTAAAARDYDRAADIAGVTGLSEATVRRRLTQVTHGRKLVRNVFWDWWPEDQEAEIDADELAKMTSAAARDQNRAVDIAKVTGLSEADVRRKLDRVSHGRKLVHNVFWDWWPEGQEAEIDAEALGRMTSAAARDQERAVDIARVTGLSEVDVRRKLKRMTHGQTLVRTLFSDWWPEPEGSYENSWNNENDVGKLRELTAAPARDDARLVGVAGATGFGYLSNGSENGADGDSHQGTTSNGAAFFYGRADARRGKKNVIDVFIAYSHQDAQHLNRLLERLNSIDMHYVPIVLHYDRQINPGMEWEPALAEKLGQADVVLLLISPSFMGSGSCNKEVEQARKMSKGGRAAVIPILVRRTSDWEDVWLGKLEAIPKSDEKVKAISEWARRDAAWDEVSKRLRFTLTEQAELRGVPLRKR